MLNRFKNAIYGTSTTNDDSPLGIAYTDYKDTVIGKRIRGALTRSSSFRDELLSETAKSRLGNTDHDARTSDTGLQRGRSQVLRRSTITEEEEQEDAEVNGSNLAAANNRQFSRRNQSTLTDSKRSGQKVAKFRYTRPEFLQLRTDDEISVSADHQIRPIILPRDASRLPWLSGYAECINAGKSAKNEDQAVCYQDVVVGYNSRSDNIKGQLPFTIFGLFDGHAGNAVAVAAAAQLHHIISEKLRHVADILIALEFGDDTDINDDEQFEDCISSPTSRKKRSSVQNDPVSVEMQSLNEITSDDDDTSTTISKHEEEKDPEGEKEVPQIECSGKVEPSKIDDCNPFASSEQAQSNLNNESSSQMTELKSDPSKTNQNDDNLECEKSENNPTLSVSDPVDMQSNQADQNSNTASERFQADLGPENSFTTFMIALNRKNITVEKLVRGALESSFWEMDELIGNDKEYYKMPGGCAAIVSLFILGRLYVCNAGDSRAIVCKSNRVIPMSFDFTPTSERERILRLGHQRPELLGNDFTHLEFIKRPTRKDLGKRMLYRDAYMTGWSMKEISYDDLKFPLVWGEGKRSRLCACIGLSRGFGDHELRAQYGSVPIKPFLTPEPEVRVLDLRGEYELTNEDVLIQASDGLWDVATNQEIFELVKRSLSIDNEVARSKYRYISVAQDLVGWSRGSTTESCSWRMSDGRFASMDDISVFVVPLKQYRDEYLEWKRLRNDATVPRTRNTASGGRDNE